MSKGGADIGGGVSEAGSVPLLTWKVAVWVLTLLIHWMFIFYPQKWAFYFTIAMFLVLTTPPKLYETKQNKTLKT